MPDEASGDEVVDVEHSEPGTALVAAHNALNPETGELVVYAPMALEMAPARVLAQAREAAAALLEVINLKKRPVKFKGETYLEFEDWQTVAQFYGASVKITWTRPVAFPNGVCGFEAAAIVLHRGQEVASAEAMCLNDELNWKDKPMFQLRSMAQTRAGAKALRNRFAWVVVLAGCRPTPAEEMTGQEQGGTDDGAYDPTQHPCPECGKPSLIKSDAKYGGGWTCWKRRDGCGARFKDDDPRMTGKPQPTLPTTDEAAAAKTAAEEEQRRLEAIAEQVKRLRDEVMPLVDDGSTKDRHMLAARAKALLCGLCDLPDNAEAKDFTEERLAKLPKMIGILKGMATGKRASEMAALIDLSASLTRERAGQVA